MCRHDLNSLYLTTIPLQDEGEWKEVEYEKDYSGLKIQSLTIKDKEEELREQKLQEATEQFEIKMTESGGPWNRNTKSDTKNADQSSDDEVEEEKEVEEKKEEKEMPVPPTAAPKSGTYVPPHLRNKDSSSATAASSTTSDGLTPMKMSSLKGRMSTSSRAPAIENTMEFPSLGQEAPAPVVADTGHAVWRDTSRTSAPLKTENRYDALKKAGRD